MIFLLDFDYWVAKYFVDRLHYQSLREAAKKKPFLFGISFPNPPTPGFLWDLGKRKVKFGSKKAIFGSIWGGFEGFGPCLGISHPNHTHLGKLSQKKRFYFWGAPLTGCGAVCLQSFVSVSWIISWLAFFTCMHCRLPFCPQDCLIRWQFLLNLKMVAGQAKRTAIATPGHLDAWSLPVCILESKSLLCRCQPFGDSFEKVSSSANIVFLLYQPTWLPNHEDKLSVCLHFIPPGV